MKIIKIKSCVNLNGSEIEAVGKIAIYERTHCPYFDYDHDDANKGQCYHPSHKHYPTIKKYTELPSWCPLEDSDESHP